LIVIGRTILSRENFKLSNSDENMCYVGNILFKIKNKNAERKLNND